MVRNPHLDRRHPQVNARRRVREVSTVRRCSICRSWRFCRSGTAAVSTGDAAADWSDGRASVSCRGHPTPTGPHDRNPGKSRPESALEGGPPDCFPRRLHRPARLRHRPAPAPPVYANDLLEPAGISRQLHGWVIGGLMSVFSLMQFIFAPIWGRISDRVGRRPILILGLAGSVVFYALFGYASTLGRPAPRAGAGA